MVAKAHVVEEKLPVAPAKDSVAASEVSLYRNVLKIKTDHALALSLWDTGNVDAHSDLWSVSVVLYEMLAGQQPFRGESTRRLEEHIRSRTLPPEMDASCPRALVAVLHKALAPALERRYPDAAALHADLTAFLEGRDTEAERECSVAARYEETRRTVGPEGEREGAGTRRTLEASGNGSSPAEAETRRTLPEGSAAAGAISPSPPAPPEGTAAQTAPRASGRRFRVSWKLVVLLAGVLLVANEAQVMSAATELKGALPGLPRGEADAVWKRYRQLRARSLLRVGSFGLGRDVRDWFVASADELIADYRSDTPVIRENGWRSAISLLGRAASIAPRGRCSHARGVIATAGRGERRPRGPCTRAAAGRSRAARRSCRSGRGARPRGCTPGVRSTATAGWPAR